MQNLLGRLNARSEGDLERIAAFWHVPLPDGPRHRRVGALYRALTDPRSARDVWAALSDNQRPLVRLLALIDPPGLTVAEIAGRLGADEGTVREIAVTLYRAGVVARQGDDDPLPEGVAPVLFLPREVALLFRRIFDEMEAGDLGETPLRALLELIDDTELESAARTWGSRVIPGLRGRDDLIEQILRLVADRDRLDNVVATRRRESRQVWDLLRERAGEGPVALTEVASRVGLDGAGLRPRVRLRETLADLEEALLVWHTYRGDERALFIPADLRRAGTPGPDLPPLSPVLPGTVQSGPWRPAEALAWDLLTTLRDLALPGAPEIDDPEDIPRPWSRGLNRRLWYRGEDLPPTGYLPFLLALGRAAGLLRVETDDPDHPWSVATGAARAWRDLSFPGQMETLRSRWLAHPDWVEGTGRGDLDVWGADWRGFRRRLLGHLASLPHPADGAGGTPPGDAATSPVPENATDAPGPVGEGSRGVTPNPTMAAEGPAPGENDGGPWYPLDDLAAWVAARDADLLGPTFTVASARHPSGEGLDDAGRRRAAVAQAVGIALETALAWFGVVEVRGRGRDPRVVRVIDPATTGPVPTERSESERGDRAALAVHADGTIDLLAPTPLRVWSLATFTEAESLDRVSRYRLTAKSFQRALAAGFDQAQVTGFLSRQAGGDLPRPVRDRLDEWVRQYRRVTLRHAMVLEPDDPAALADLRREIEARGLRAAPLDGTRLLVEAAPAAIDALRAHLAASHYAPRWGDTDAPGGTPVAPSPATPSPPPGRDRPARPTRRG